MRRFLSFLTLALVVTSAEAAPDRALILCGNDNTLSTVNLTDDTSTLAEASFPGFPGQGVIEGARYYAVVSGADRVAVFDVATLAPVDTLYPGPGTNPYAVAGDGAGNVVVTLFNTGEAVRYDASGTETGRAAVGDSPEGVLFFAGRWFVAATGYLPATFSYGPGTVSVVEDATFTVAATVPVGRNPQWLTEASGEIHVICTGDYFSVFGESHILDPAAAAPVDTVVLGGSPGMIVAGGGRAYTTDYFGGIFSYDTATRTILHDAGNPILVGGTGYSGLALDGLGNLFITFFADDLCARLRLADNLVTGVFPTGDGPGSVVLREESPVPVRLASFTLTRREGVAVIVWEVTDPDGAAAFRVERGTGGRWTPLAEIPVGGPYQVEDATPPPPGGAYRLTALLRDGTEALLGTRVLPGEAGVTPLVRLRTNPVRDRLAVTLLAPGPVALRLFDPAGRLVRSLEARPAGSAAFDVSDLPSGVYFLHARSARRATTSRVVVLP